MYANYNIKLMEGQIVDKEMEVLLSEKEIKLGEKKVIVKRIALLDTIRLASHISEVVSVAVNSSEAVTNALYKIGYQGDTESKDSSEDVLNGVRITGFVEIFGILGKDGTDLLKELIVKSTNLTDEEAEQVDCVDGVDLLSTIYEVNKGFFGKLSSKLKEKLQKVKPAKKDK